MRQSSTKLSILPRKPDASVTPQRKHRKLLKDGSGSEVWPENVEALFVNGLREYWDSPWATYSRGRSRWRNQFLVEHLRKGGVDRSKKQVASHIQVLRNMWKGTSQYHLVAGGEELGLDPMTPIKTEDNAEHSPLHIFKFDEADSPASSTSASGSSPEPGYVKLEVSASPTQRLSPVFDSFSPEDLTNLPHDELLFAAAGEVAYSCSPVRSNLSPCMSDEFQAQLHVENEFMNPHGFTGTHVMTQRTVSTPSTPYLTASNVPPPRPTIFTGSMPTTYHSAPVTPIDTTSNAVTSLCLWAEGMSLLRIPTSSHQKPTPTTLKLKLYIPSIDDIRCPPALHGFQGTVNLTAPWINSARCLTRVFANGVCISEEPGSLELTSPDVRSAGRQQVVAFLPESWLTRSRWLNADLQTTITQEIVVDGRRLSFMVYEFDRLALGSGVSAEVISAQNQFVPHKAATVPALSAYTSFYNQTSAEQLTQRYCRAEPAISPTFMPTAPSMLY